jgi:hypothetical protein
MYDLVMRCLGGWRANWRVQKHYEKGSPDRQTLADAVAAFKKQSPIQVPIVVGGKQVGAVLGSLHHAGTKS